VHGECVATAKQMHVKIKPLHPQTYLSLVKRLLLLLCADYHIFSPRIITFWHSQTRRQTFFKTCTLNIPIHEASSAFE
jgi:hypothetical protein